MKTLEEQIRSLVDRGKFSHLSLAQEDGRNWRAVFAPSVGANVHGVDSDPVKALLLALAGTPRAAARVQKPGDPRALDEDELEFG